MKRWRILFLAIGVLGLLLGLFWEEHIIRPLGSGAATAVGGTDFVAGAAVDSFMLKNDALYFVAPEAASTRDCKT
jgi:hypothetical protein